MSRSPCTWLACLLLSVALPALANPVTSRPFALDDLFQLESIGEAFGGPFAFSRQGQLAFVRLRPRSSVADYRWEWLAGNAAGDVWLHDGRGDPVNLTRGSSDGSGWWAPAWSPDGRQLAMLSNRGGTVRVWLWQPGREEPRLLANEALAARGDGRHFHWLDDHHLLLETLGPGASSANSQVGLTTPELAARGWSGMLGGQTVTASVLDTGAATADTDSAARLLLVDVRDASQRVLANGAVSTVLPSPDRGHLALLREQPGPPPAADRPPQWDNSLQRLELRARDGTAVVLRGAPLRYRETPELRWAPDGRRLALLGTEVDAAAPDPSLRIIDLADATVRAIPLGPVAGDDVRLGLQWQGSEVLLLRAETCARACEEPRVRWWSVKPGGTLSRFDIAGETTLRTLWPGVEGGSWSGWSGQSLLRLEPAPAGGLRPLGPALEADRVEWPAPADDGAWPRLIEPAPASIVLGRDSESGRQMQVVGLADATDRPLPIPHPEAQLRDWDPVSRSAVFVRDDERGLWAWRVQADSGRTTRLLHANAFLERIEPIDARRIRYRSQAGEDLDAWLLRPAGTPEDRALPLLTYIYPGSTAGEALPWGARANVYSHLHLRIPLAHGYAVLMPSMPLAEDETEPLAGFVGTVLPAVDQVVGEGLADPARLYLMGHSYGGYATLGMIARTDRFHAAIALAGASNLIDLYGQFDPRLRYQTDALSAANFGMLWLEDGQGRMAAPPWREPQRYLRNSPLFQVEHVTTPVLLIQGDLDAVPIEQNEQYISALHRLGKRGRFVRYWGEGHLLRSPANIRDMWQRILAWMDEFHGDPAAIGAPPD